jgi:FtsZ-binding cell division protein ZapB
VNELLRYWAFKLCGKGEQESAASDVMTAAADEIERLREENDKLRNHHKKIWTESYNAMLAGKVKP